jgi:hypothetical protein
VGGFSLAQHTWFLSLEIFIKIPPRPPQKLIKVKNSISFVPRVCLIPAWLGEQGGGGS